MRHHAIIVTSWDHEALKQAHDRAIKLFTKPSRPYIGDRIANVSEILPETCNGYQSFFVAPDGSKESWDHSDAGEDAREKFKAFLRTPKYENGGNSLDWVEVQFGDDNGETTITADSDERIRSKAEGRGA